MAVINDLLDRADSEAPAPPRRLALQSPVLLGVLAGLQAAVVGLFLTVIPVVLVWLTTSGVRMSLDEAIRVGSLFWLAGHGSHLSLISGQLSVAPLGVTLVSALCCLFISRRVNTALSLVERGSADARTALAHAGFVITYVLIATMAAIGGSVLEVRPQTETAALGALVLSSVTSGAGLWSRGSWWRRRSVSVASSRQGDWIRAGLASLLFAYAVSVVLIGVLTLTGYSRIQALYDALHPGSMGSFWLGVLQFTLLPNLATYGVTFLAGPGFAVGTNTSVTTAGLTLGPLPALPVLGILPTPGPLPSWVAWAAPLLVVAGGVLAGRVLGVRHRREATPAREALADVLAAAGVTGLLAAGLTWFASGSLGPGNMSTWGASGLRVGLWMAGLTGLGMLVTASVLPRLRRNRTKPAEQVPADQAP